MFAVPLCSHYHSIQFKVSLSMPFRLYRIAKYLCVSIQYLDHHETCIKMQSCWWSEYSLKTCICLTIRYIINVMLRLTLNCIVLKDVFTPLYVPLEMKHIAYHIYHYGTLRPDGSQQLHLFLESKHGKLRRNIACSCDNWMSIDSWNKNRNNLGNLSID